jgi:hypothetical protein
VGGNISACRHFCCSCSELTGLGLYLTAMCTSLGLTGMFQIGILRIPMFERQNSMLLNIGTNQLTRRVPRRSEPVASLTVARSISP